MLVSVVLSYFCSYLCQSFSYLWPSPLISEVGALDPFVYISICFGSEAQHYNAVCVCCLKDSWIDMTFYQWDIWLNSNTEYRIPQVFSWYKDVCICWLVLVGTLVGDHTVVDCTWKCWKLNLTKRLANAQKWGYCSTRISDEFFYRKVVGFHFCHPCWICDLVFQPWNSSSVKTVPPSEMQAICLEDLDNTGIQRKPALHCISRSVFRQR